MGKQALEEKLEALRALRLDPASAVEPVRKALQDRNNFLVSKAASMAGELGVQALAPDLIAAFDRFLINPVKSDPQCWAKNALAKALKDLNQYDSAVFLRGLRHIQMEPVWGGSADTAAALRGACALALIACPLPRLDILQNLVDLLAADLEQTVRVDAARAIAQLAGPDSLLLLRMKALCGDKEPEVIGQCFLGLLDLSPVDSVPFVAAFLQKEDADVRLEAATALADCPREEAVDFVKQAWRKAQDANLRRAIILSLGGSRLESAAEFLCSVLSDGKFEDASDAIRALAGGRFRDQYRQRAEEALCERDESRLIALFRKEFATS